MLSWRAAAAIAVGALLSTRLTTCRSPGEGGSEASPSQAAPRNVNLRGIDTSELTEREKGEWSRYVSELLAPCPEHPVSLAQCVNESRPCAACAPAASLIVREVRRGRVRAQIEGLFKARFSPEAIRPIELDDSPSKGLSGAPVVVVEWADFECPACAAARPVLDEIGEKYPNEVRLVFKHFPLSMHPHAEKAARAAVAARHQGKFWEMHAALFENQRALDPAHVEQLAKELGLDMKKFVQDRDSEATADVVARERKQGMALDIQSTPSIFINGRLFPPTTDFEDDLREWIDLEIRLKKASPAAARPPSPPPAAPAASAPPAASVPARAAAPAPSAR